MKELTEHLQVNLEKWSISILTGLFLFITLFIYRAYDVDAVEAYSGHSLLSRALIQGIGTSFVFYIFHFHIDSRLQINQKWKPLALNGLSIFAGLNVAFLLFNYFYNWTELHWLSYVNFLYEYPLVVVIPILISYLIGLLNRQSTTNPARDLKFSSKNGKQTISIKPENFLYLKSVDNYIELYYLNGEGINKELFRNTLKDIEQEHSGSPFVKRCHRSYLVNPTNIQVTSLTSMNSLKLLVGQTEIPVSSKYQKGFIGN